MTAPPPPDDELARLRQEIEELRARIARLEDLVFPPDGAGAASAPPPEAPAPGDEASIEPVEPWNVGGGGAPR